MKKLTALLLTAAIMTAGAAAFSAEAEENLTAVPISADTDTRIAVIDVKSEADIAGYINDDTIILDKNGNRTDKVPVGSRAVVQISANIIAVLDADVPSSADIDIYSVSGENEFGDYINTAGSLALNMGDTTDIKDLEGNKLTVDDIADKILVVYYDFMTMSIPAQTTPTTIVVIGEDQATPLPLVDGEKLAMREVLGTVKSIDKTYVTVESEDGTETVFGVTKKTPIFTQDGKKENKVKEGDKVKVFTESAVLSKDIKSADAVVITDDNSITNVMVSKFKAQEKSLISEDESLVLNVKESDIKKYADRKLIVFYDVTTRSLPPQTTPIKIYTLDKCSASIKFKVGDSILSINGENKEVIKPYVIGAGTTLVPLRVISEAFGAEVSWDGETKTVLIVDGDKTITLQIGNKKAFVNDEEKALESAAELKDDTTMVPLRFISEALDADVEYDEATQGITVER